MLKLVKQSSTIIQKQWSFIIAHQGHDTNDNAKATCGLLVSFKSFTERSLDTFSVSYGNNNTCIFRGLLIYQKMNLYILNMDL